MSGGKRAPPTMAMTSRDDPALVSGPRFLMLRAKIVGNMIEWKNPAATTPATAADPDPRRARETEAAAPQAKIASIREAGIYFMRNDPAKRPAMKPSRWSFR